MESKSFVKLLRKVIREEVRAAVRTEIKLVLNESTTITISSDPTLILCIIFRDEIKYMIFDLFLFLSLL